MFPLRTDVILEWVKGPSVLDVGCTGHALQVGSDGWLHGGCGRRSRRSLESTFRQKTFPRSPPRILEPVCRRAPNHSSSATNFDTIVAGELIEHLSNPGLFLAPGACASEAGRETGAYNATPFLSLRHHLRCVQVSENLPERPAHLLVLSADHERAGATQPAQGRALRTDRRIILSIARPGLTAPSSG